MRLAVIACTLLACACNGTLPPNVVQGGVASVELAICILNTYSKDKQAGLTDGQAIGDTITHCATDAATIAQVLDASHAAEVRLADKTAVHQ